MANYLLIFTLTAIACWAMFTSVPAILYTPTKGKQRSTVSRITVVLLCWGTLAIAWVPLHTHPWALAGVACSLLAGILAATAIRTVESAAEAAKSAVTADEKRHAQNVGGVLALVTLAPWAILSLLALVCVVLAPL